jgi:hypothetical protein
MPTFKVTYQVITTHTEHIDASDAQEAMDIHAQTFNPSLDRIIHTDYLEATCIRETLSLADQKLAT